MRKLITQFLMASIFMSFLSFYGQEKSVNNQNRHEFRLDALEILVIPNFEMNYEYVINKYSGVGLALNFSLDDDFSEYQAFAIEPYYRQYLVNKKDYEGSGLFVEGLLRFSGGENDAEPTIPGSAEGKNWFDIGVGLVIGQKWVSDNGFVFEISLGGGRYLLDENNIDGFARGGVLIGYRFF